MNKAALRRQARMRLYALSEAEMRQKNSAICTNVIDSIDWKNIKSVSCYQSRLPLREVNPAGIVDYISDNLPAVRIDIVEPSAEAIMPRTTYDLIVVPVLGFDSNCNRLGRGGGWYDRFLSNQDAALKIGLAFDCQNLDSIPIEDFDVELNEIFTENPIS